MRLKMIGVIYRKEMLDLLRDRRTLASMVIVPLLVLPLLMVIGMRLVDVIKQRAEQGAKTTTIAVKAANPELAEVLRKDGLTLVTSDDPRAAVEKKTSSAGLEEAAGAQPRISVFVDSSNPTSATVGDRIRAALADLKDQKVKQALRNSGVPETVLAPFTVNKVNVAPPRKMAGMMWGTMLGYMLLLLMFSGGMYPVIDMTAGEKERKTLETFLTAPVGRSEIVLGKTLAAMTAILMTALLTLASMVYSIRANKLATKSEEVQAMFRTIPLDGHTILLIILTLLPLCVFAASVMIAIAMFARSFKEGQSYLTPLILLVLFPALLGGIPGLELTPALCLIPIFNASQIIRSILLGEFAPTPFMITMGANIAYAAIAFVISKRRFEDESVLFRS